MANLSVNPNDEPELIREREPDADDDYEDDDELDGVRIYTYEGPNYPYTKEQIKQIKNDMREAIRKPSPFNNPIGSGFSPEEVDEARRELEQRFLD